METMGPPVKKRRPVAEINVVPYIDVMLVLLIIFMVTAPMLMQSVPVDLPQVDSKPSQINPDDSTIIISVTKNGQYHIERDNKNAEVMTLTALQDYTQKVTNQVPTTRVMIRGDKAVPYGFVVELMGGLQQVGVSNVGLITEAPSMEARR